MFAILYIFSACWIPSSAVSPESQDEIGEVLEPTAEPSSNPSSEPSSNPSSEPSSSPTSEPSSSPTSEPSSSPTSEPTPEQDSEYEYFSQVTCGGEMEFWEVTGNGTLNILVDTISEDTTFDPTSSSFSSDGNITIGNGDDENPCSYPPPAFGCPEYSISYTGSAIIGVNAYSENCNPSGVGSYRLALDGEGASTATLLDGSGGGSGGGTGGYAWTNIGTQTQNIYVGCCHHLESNTKTCDSSTYGEFISVGGPTDITPNTGTATQLRVDQGMYATLFDGDTQIEWSGATGCGCDVVSTYTVEVYQCDLN